MATITVEATELGFDGMQRRRKGDRFEINEDAFSKRWMKRVKARAVHEEDEEEEERRTQKKGKGKAGRVSDESKI